LSKSAQLALTSTYCYL